MPEPPARPRRQLLVPPEKRRRIAQVFVSLLGMGVVAIAILSMLIIWHLLRRGRLIRDRLGPPRPVRLPAVEPKDPERREPEHP